MEQYISHFLNLLNTGHFSLIWLLIAFLGGVLASISPCTLGILPIIIGYVAGYSEDEVGSTFRTFAQMIFFVLGLSTVLTVVGIICALSGKVFMAIGGNYWILIMASAILLFGMNLLGILEFTMPVLVKQMPKSNRASLVGYPFTIGALFAIAATPCSTPILASIMTFATLSQNMIYAALLLFFFALGQGIIIIFVGVCTKACTNSLTKLRQFSQKSGMLMKFSGFLLILSAFFLYYKMFEKFLPWSH